MQQIDRPSGDTIEGGLGDAEDGTYIIHNGSSERLFIPRLDFGGIGPLYYHSNLEYTMRLKLVMRISWEVYE